MLTVTDQNRLFAPNTVVVNGRFLTRANPTGVDRYAFELLREFSEENKPCVILAPENVQQKYLDAWPFPNIHLVRMGWLTGNLWEQLELPIYTAGQLLFNPCNMAPLVKKDQVVTIHDAAVFAAPDGYSRVFRTWYRFALRTIAKRSRHILTVSEFSKRELMKYLRIPESKITMAYEGSDHTERW